MPSGITHMMLSREVTEKLHELKDGKIARILNRERGAFIAGSVGPDLPYMPVAIFKPTSKLADEIHTKSTNKIPLYGLKKARELFEQGNEKDAKVLFAFYLGYASHLSADGVIHPFVRDMVGDYEHAKVAHRTLEVKLDVLLADHFFDGNCVNMKIHEELSYLKDSANESIIYESFADAINQAFPGWNITNDLVEKWVINMDILFDVASGSFPAWYRDIFGEKGLVHKQLDEIRSDRESLIVLKTPKPHDEKQLPHNFMEQDVVNLIDDVIPMYFSVFPKIATAAFEYVFENGPEPTETILEINLDTGRLLAQSDFNLGPAYRGLA